MKKIELSYGKIKGKIDDKYICNIESKKEGIIPRSPIPI